MTYQRTIVEMGTPAELAYAVEELMREQYRTLDHLDLTTFRREVRLAMRTIAEIRALAKSGDALGIMLMSSYRIPPDHAGRPERPVRRHLTR